MDMQFYKCPKCGNIVAYVKHGKCNVVCCGEEMKEMKPNTSDGAGEKHVPVIEQYGDHITVKVGSVPHPMLEAHYITFVVLETNLGYQKKDLTPGGKPEAVFALADGEKAVAAYEYCNLHGLWKTEV